MLAKQLQGAAKGVAVDSDFENVTLLLHGNGTNGAQNNTFLDSSTNNFTITRNGNTTQGTFSPYGDNWSNYFNGGSDRISNASASVMDFGTNNFTVEMWVYLTSTADQMFFEGPSNTGFQFFLQSGVLYAGTSAVVTAVSYTLPSGFANSWHHICVVREGTGSNQTSLYVDGVRQSQGTLSTNYTTTGFQISRTSGYLVYGYISNLRVVKGTAVYTGASFTVPSAPLTAITNTSLLTCQSNRFIDNSTNAFTITRNGDVSVQRFSPFSPTAAYASGTIGGSGYFDGTGDYLQATAGAVDAIGTGDFQISGWWYLNELKDYQILFDFRNGTNNENVPYIYVPVSGTPDYYVNAVSHNFSAAMKAKEWTYILVSRVGSTTKAFMNGTEVLSYTDSTNYVAGRLTLGFNNNGSGSYFYYNGYIAGFRVVVGTGTTSGSVPTSPPTAITNTKALLNFTNAGIIDNAMMNDLETVGNAQISTTQSKFGGSSMYFDGSGDWLLVPSSQNFNMGTGDWTVECWAYASANTARGLFQITTGHLNATATGIGLGVSTNSGNPWRVYHGTTATDTGTNIVTSTWIHVAFVRSGSSVKLYLDGTSVYTATDSSNLSSYTFLTIGAWYDSNYPWNGYIDDLRITKGIARYTANFTAPTAPFADQ